MLMQADVLSALQPDTLEELVKTYNRLRAANDLWANAYDLLAGPAALIAYGFGSLAGSTVIDGAQKHRANINEKLADRVQELIPIVEEAQRLVARDLGGD